MNSIYKIVSIVSTMLLLTISTKAQQLFAPEHEPFIPASSFPSLTDVNSRPIMIVNGDTIRLNFFPFDDVPSHDGPLTDDDYFEAADTLGVEPAAIRAVVEIETGKTFWAFHTPGKPIINFDLAVFRRAAIRNGVDIVKAQVEYPEVFAAPNISKYGSQQAAQQARLDGAMAIDSLSAIEGTFWGMFQLGGFNWKLCGASSPSDFIRRMSRSEWDQLMLFVNFIRNTGLSKHLRQKNWAVFSRLYNGPGYEKGKYHTRMEAAYYRYKKTMKRSVSR